MVRKKSERKRIDFVLVGIRLLPEDAGWLKKRAAEHGISVSSEARILFRRVIKLMRKDVELHDL